MKKPFNLDNDPGPSLVERLCHDLSVVHHHFVEAELIRSVEEHLGRVPSNNEVAAHGRAICSAFSPVTDYYWDSHFLVGIKVCLSTGRFDLHSLSSPTHKFPSPSP